MVSPQVKAPAQAQGFLRSAFPLSCPRMLLKSCGAARPPSTTPCRRTSHLKEQTEDRCPHAMKSGRESCRVRRHLQLSSGKLLLLVPAQQPRRPVSQLVRAHNNLRNLPVPPPAGRGGAGDRCGHGLCCEAAGSFRSICSADSV